MPGRRPDSFDRRDAIDFDVEAAVPGGDANEDARREVLREVFPIDLIHIAEQFDRRAVDVALQHVVQRRTGRLERPLHLLEYQFSLAFDGAGSLDDLARLRVERRGAAQVERVAVSRDRAGGRLVLPEQARERLDVDDFSLHRFLLWVYTELVELTKHAIQQGTGRAACQS